MTCVVAIVSRVTILVGLGVSLAACGNAAGDFVRSTGLGPTTAQPQGFVVQSRPNDIDFISIGTAKPGPTNPAKNAQQVKDAETEMDSLRARNANAGAAAAAAGGTPLPDPALTPANMTKAKKSPSTNP